MARRRRASAKKPPDAIGRDLEADSAQALGRHFESESIALRSEIAKLYGQLPAWLPEPVLPQIERAITSLRQAEQSDERIAELVAAARTGRLVDAIPGTALDLTDFLKSVYELAHVQWALGLGKARAIEELSGERAARDYQRSKQGNEKRYGTEAQLRSRNSDIRAKAEALQARNPRLGVNAVASQLAPAFRLSAGHIKRILRLESELPKK